jgi:hypothetical protein
MSRVLRIGKGGQEGKEVDRYHRNQTNSKEKKRKEREINRESVRVNSGSQQGKSHQVSIHAGMTY